ncbi:hypothetical protein [Rhizobium esperanzae]|uniref:Uncharacterized protein n=1 Tax=Rhizobium esperanzae TaxID=1967781 RepID=A0A7W6W6K2_9HYPH|nr:hypothetical protein [Rhizobium esperanzae]MBB4237779.1 hypothetical protein [Rhizobium esperanzae]
MHEDIRFADNKGIDPDDDACRSKGIGTLSNAVAAEPASVGGEASSMKLGIIGMVRAA